MPRLQTAQEDDTIIAALRLWQNLQEDRMALVTRDGNPAGLDHFDDVATNMGLHPALTADEIDTLLDDVYGIV